ncbi:MAG: pirin family protein [Actinomycetota bacterium]|nr:pirin family protein [Actinomycetota bacterium]
MPAVTVENLLLLPRLRQIDASIERPRKVASVTAAPKGFEGEGFPVRRAFAGVNAADLDPFIHMDQMGEVNYAPGEPKGTPWHPHRGFETVTYMIDGTFLHQDSTGGGGVIQNGATQWMTAGAGILHIETPPESLVVSGGLFHGIQLWVNLPAAKKFTQPQYQNLEGEDVTLITSHDGSSLIRVVAGNLESHTGPGSTMTPITFIHASVESDSQLELPWPREYNSLVYVLSGEGSVGSENAKIKTGNLAVLKSGDYLSLRSKNSAKGEKLEVLVLGGAPIREPIAWHGPFVMNTRDELIQAFEDYQSGRMGQIPPQYHF